MGNSCCCCRFCRCCCRRKLDKSIQVLRTPPAQSLETSSNSKPQKSATTSTNTTRFKTIGTSPIQTEVKSIGTLAKIKSPLHEDPSHFTIIPKTPLDTSSLDHCVNDAVFSEEVDEPIELNIVQNKPPLKKTTDTKLNPKNTSNTEWNEKYFLHGDLSDIVADMKSKTHGCINSSISEDIDQILFIFHEINIKVGEIFKNRSSKISAKEKKYVENCILKRDELIEKLLAQGRSYEDQYEKQYRRILQEFIKKLELNLSIYLDSLHGEIDAEKESIILKTNDQIKQITKKAGEAKKEVYHRVENAGDKDREELMKKVTHICNDKTNQLLGYEQLRTLELKVYSTVGMKKDGQGCDGIPEREDFIQLIKNAKSHEPQTKRTVYLQSDFSRTSKKNTTNP